MQQPLRCGPLARPATFSSRWGRVLTLLALLLTGSGAAWGQSVANYTPARTTGNTYTSISATGTSFTGWRNTNSTDDNLSGATPIGFTFIYDGTPYTQFSVSTNGYLTFNTGTSATGSGSGVYGYQNTQFSTTGGTVTTLAPFYDDQQTANNASTLADLNASLKYQTTGTAPNRVLTAEWINMQDFSTTSTSTFNYQVKLYEADGHIEYNYGTMTLSNTSTVTTMSYSLGINSPTGGPTAANLLTLQTANTNTFGSTASDALGGNTTAGLPATGTRYSFTPPQAAVAAPSPVAFNSISYNSVRVTFVDNSTNETNFSLLRSTDGITYTVVATSISPTPATSGTGYFFTVTGLTPGTLYYFQVLANSEGVGSSASGSVTTLAIPASLSGTFTINNTQATNATTTGGNFNNFTDAITALNATTVSGPITFNVSNNQTFSELPPVITATGTSANTITFKEATLSASLTDNPVLKPTGTTSALDAGLLVSGGDYFTFDGINVDASGGTAMEFGYVVRNASATNGATSNTIRNAAITLNRTNTSSIGVVQSSSSTYASGTTPTATGGANGSNTYSNLQIRNAYNGVILYAGSTTYPDLATQVSSCAIGDPATAGDIGNGSSTVYGIYAYQQSGVTLSGNTIRNVLATTAAYGILVTTAAGTSSVNNNQIGTVRNSSTSSTSAATGLGAGTLTTGTHMLNIYNNFIFDITHGFTGTATNSRYVRGIYLTSSGASTQTLNVWYNSVRLETPSTYTASSSNYEITSASGAVINTRNNAFANFSVGPASATAKHYVWVSTSATAVGNTGSVSNYNDLYVANQAGTQGFVGYGNTTTYPALSDWRTATSQEANSISVDPLFTSALDLHAQGSSPLDAKATPIATVTTDIDGNTRDTTTPDIGGDEFTPPSADVTLTSINGPTVPFTAGSNQVTITITNAGLDALTKVDVSYTFNGTTNNLGTQTLGTPLAFGQSTTITLANLSFAPGVNTLSVTLSNPNGVADPTPAGNTLTQTYRPALCGNYNVAASGGDFTTLDAAVAALNQAGVSCAVTFTLLDATYPATTGIVINTVLGASSTNTVTIKPGSGVNSTIAGSVATGAVLKLNGATYVTIDGSNNGTTSQNLTISNTSATGSGNAVVWLAAASATQGATNNTVKNTLITGNSAAGFPQFTVFVGGGGTGVTAPTTSTPANCGNNTIQNNVITKGYYGVFVYGVSATNLDQGNQVLGNQIGQSTAGNGFGLEGVRAVNQQNLLVQQNEIQNVVDASANSHYGVRLITTVGAVINRNSVHNVQSNSTTSGNVGYGISLANTTNTTSASPSSNTVSNNLVYNISAPLAATSANPNVLGIANNGGYGDRLLFNTILLNAAQTAGTGYSAAISNGDSQNTPASSALDVRNNIVALTANVSTAAKYFGFYTSAASVSGSTLDYNDYYLGGSGSATFAVGNLNGTSLSSSATLAAWQTATSQEANSKSVDPGFAQTGTVPFDLTPSNVTLNNAGATGTGIVVDYTGATRGATPDIGAIEFTPPLTLDLKPMSLLAPSTTNLCYGATEAITVQIQNNGGANIDYSQTPATVTVVVTPPSGAANNQTFTTTLNSGTLASGAGQNVTLPGTLDMTALGAYSFAISATVPGDVNTSDNITATRTNAASQASLPYAEPFNSGTLPTNFTTTVFSPSTSANNGGASGSYGLRAELYYTTSRQATTPILGTTISANNQLTFDARFTNYSSGTGYALQAGDKLEVQVAVCGGAFTTVYTINSSNYNGNNTASTSFYTYNAPLTGVGAGQKIQVRLVATYGGNGDYYLDLDNLNVQSLAGTDLSPTALAAPTATQGCYGSAEPVTVTVKNPGTSLLNFSVNPATVTVNVTGAATATLTGTVTSGTLAAGATQNVTLSSGGPAGNGTLNMTTAGTYTFAVTATVMGDQNTNNDNLTPNPTRTVVAPTLTSISASPTTLCNSGTVTLTATGATGGTVTWYSSADNYTTPIGTGSPLTLNNVSATTSYQANVQCNSNTSANSNTVTVTVSNPQLTATTGPGTVCQGSTATVTATGSTGTTVRIFATATGGTALATGTAGAGTVSYTSPALTTTGTSTYYAEAAFGSQEATGMPAPNAGDGNYISNGTGVLFTVNNAPITLTSTTIYPVGTGTVNIALYDNTGAQVSIGGVLQETGNVNVTGTGVSTPVVVPLNFANIPVGTNYRLLVKAYNGITGLVRGTASASNYSTPSGSVTNVNGSLTPPSTSSSYYFFYNLVFGNMCTSGRTAINVNVTAAPALTVTPGSPQTICAGGSVSVTASGNGYTAYTYSPGTGVTLTSADGSTATLAPTTTTTYTITATGAPGGCSATQTLTINVNAVPGAPTLTPPASTICVGNSTTVTASSTGSAAAVAILATADFNTGANGFTTTPAGNTSVSAGFARKSAPFTLGTAAVSTNGPDNNSSGAFYVADSDVSGSSFTSTLLSPAFSTVGYSSATLNFQQYFRYNSSETAVVEYSTNGSTWANLATYTATQGSATGVQPVTSLPLPAAAIGKASVQIRFRYVANNNWYWTIDNVGVTGTPVPVYSVSPSTGVSVNGATLTFSPTSTTTYQVTAAYPATPGCPSPATPITITVNTSTAWTGATSTDWFTSTNWTNCVPTRYTDATIPAGAPNYPALAASTTAEVRSLTLDNGSSLSQSAGTLNLYGSLTDNTPAANLSMSGGMVAFLGASPQLLGTGTPAFYDLAVSLSSGSLTMSGNATVTHSLTMTAGVLSTGPNTLTLDGATIAETDASYVTGNVATSRVLTAGTADNFGGLGLTLTPAAGSVSPSRTLVTRTTGTALAGAGTSQSVQRYFDIQPTVNTGLNVQLDFSYFDHERNGIAAANAQLFKSITGTGGPWQAQASTTSGNTVTMTGISDFSIWTVGDRSNPLPVQLARFEAQKQGTDALLSWTTASELNNRGFEVQVSLDGATYRTLGFVAGAGSSSNARSYRYLDAEAGKAGLRYYRLRQLDLSGSATYSPVRSLAFEAAGLLVQAAPNPFGSSLTLSLTLPAASTTPAELLLTDALGRTVLHQALPALPAGTTQAELAGAGQLPAGVYLLRVSVAGTTRTLKVVRE